MTYVFHPIGHRFHLIGHPSALCYISERLGRLESDDRHPTRHLAMAAFRSYCQARDNLELVQRDNLVDVTMTIRVTSLDMVGHFVTLYGTL